MNGVSRILSSKYGISCRPGAKAECPFCHHITLFVKSDDTLAKCFYPTCGHYITQLENKRANDLFRANADIFEQFHDYLVGLSGSNVPNPYNYCVEDRGIHPQVVADSMLGAVPPGFRVGSVFGEYITNAEEAAEAEEKVNSKKKGLTAKDRLVQLEKAQELLKRCIEDKEHRVREGLLAFFYTDAAHRIVAIRFRQPYTANFTSFRPTKIGGVFNHGLFKPCESNVLQSNDLLVFEGEFNQLQYQSLCARVAMNNGRAPESGYAFCCAVGGVGSADVETIRRLSDSPVVCYDNDANKAGLALVDSLLEVAAVKAFTTPDTDSDMDEFIRSFGGDTTKAQEAVQDLRDGSQLRVRPYNAVKAEVDEVRRSQGGKLGLREFEVIREVVEIISADLKTRGRFYHDCHVAYFFFDGEKRLVAIDGDNRFIRLAMSAYGIEPTEALFRHVVSSLSLVALREGTLTEVYPFSHYDLKTNVLYVFNHGQQVYRISTGGIALVDNGTDGVLFLQNVKWETFSLLSQVSEDSLFDQLILAPMRFRDDRVRAEERKLLFRTWFFAMFFPELFPTRPILAVIGEKGSRKTSLLRRIGQLLYGPNFDVTQMSDDARDFDAAVTNNSFVVLDNADRKCNWLNDRLAVVATGGNVKRRDYFTTNTLVEFKVLAFVGITSRTPFFRREDVAERLLLLYVERIDSFLAESNLQAELQSRRNLIMSEVIQYLQKIVQALDAQRGENYATKFRMADFAAFALKIAHSEGRAEQLSSILDRTANEQSSFTLEEDPVVELLSLWLEESNAKNCGRAVKTAVLCEELSQIAQTNSIQFEFAGDTKKFGNHLSDIKSALRECFDLTEETKGGRYRYFSFTPKQTLPETGRSSEEETIEA